jgi:tRNA (guanine-N7-)-methyltransferase
MMIDRFLLILMQAANHSRTVRSSQAGIHPRLGRLLDRYEAREWAQPLHPPSCDAFEALQALLANDKRDRVLDAGCGTGASTRFLARRFPGALVIGVDKSADRLARLGAGKFPRREGNAVWIRAELETFWRLAARAGWRLQRHYLLYPNPWPKPGQLQRRWHAHPVFPALLALGGRLEMRTNWRVYAEEFAFVLARRTGADLRPSTLHVTEPLSPFERKYRDSGHALYSVVLDSSGV